MIKRGHYRRGLVLSIGDLNINDLAGLEMLIDEYKGPYLSKEGRRKILDAINVTHDVYHAAEIVDRHGFKIRMLPEPDLNIRRRRPQTGKPVPE